MDVVKLGLEIPFFFRIADLEAHVRRDIERGLDEAEVCADDLGAGVQVGEVDCPDACAGTYVEDMLGMVAYGREMQLAVEGETEEVVLQVEAVPFESVVWEDVLAIFEAVVVAAVFFYDEVAVEN
jgi:hypothetical protein